ncbi:hypothetical protein [Brevundimonas sp.]|uniref:hypothetical protein n=1 Tax=Brevundimonas sp. TaxID=1871086 RepID=UPI0035ADDD50
MGGVAAADDDRVWKQTNKWAAKRLGRGRYVEVPGARHEVVMETDDRRAVLLEEFDAMAAYVSPVEDLAPATAPAAPASGPDLGSPESSPAPTAA